MSGSSVLEELSDTVAAVAARVGPSVVGIGRRGSGVVLGEGSVATNAHNLRAEQVRVTFQDGRMSTADVSAVDVDGDLAVLSVPTGDAPGIVWADSLPSPGAAVLAAANPGGQGLRVTLGFVSSVGQAFRGPRGRMLSGSIEHTAPLLRGSSGGPVLDLQGRAVAINTHRLGEGFYLGMPVSEDLLGRLDSLKQGRVPNRRQLGIAILPGPAARRMRAAVGLPEREGVLVRAVQEGTAAARAGLRRGDLLIEVGGRPIESPGDLHAALDAAGNRIALRVVRGVEELLIDVELATGDDQT